MGGFIMKLLIMLLILISLALSACAKENIPAPVTAYEPSEEHEIVVAATEQENPDTQTPDSNQCWESHFRIIHAEPEENAENHLFFAGVPLELVSAFYGEDVTIEYFVSSSEFAPPYHTTLLLRTSGKIYPLVSLGHLSAHSILGTHNHFNDSYTFWVISADPMGFIFYQYSYDPEQGAFVETIVHVYELGYSPRVFRAERVSDF